MATDSQWPLWEVFLQPPKGAGHEHAGSVHATTAEHALENARLLLLLAPWPAPLHYTPSEAPHAQELPANATIEPDSLQ